MLISILKFLILCYDRLYESHKVFVSFYELWGIMKQKEYYTAGELARLFNIPKQTMLYYDKMGVLQPEFIAENGYRYYATPQYLTLEIILFLRKMDISVPDIRNFLQHKSREEILKVIAKREDECRQQIQEAEMLMHSLGNYREALEKSRSLPLNQVLLENCSDCRMYLTPIPKSQRGGLSAITIRARHVREAFSHCYCKEKPTGWVINRDDFFHSRFSHSSAVVTKSGPPSSSLPCNYIRPAGLYTSIHINLKSREIISISEMGLPSRHTEPSASLLFPKGDEPFPAVGKAQLCTNHPAMSASYTSCTVLSHPSAF